jgi:hypothetical protein
MKWHPSYAAMSLTAVAVSMGLVYATLLFWQLHNNYSSELAVHNWVTVRALLDAGTLHSESHAGKLLYVQLAMLAPLYLVPKLLPLGQYLVSIAAVSVLLAIWYGDLSRSGYGRVERILLISLLALTPAVVWCATSGGTGALSLLLLYLLHKAVLRIVYEGDIRAYIAAGVLMAFFLYIDAIAIYLLAILLPVLIIFIPIRQLKSAPHSSLIILGLPLLIVMVSWLYFNWVFYGDPLAFLRSDHSAFFGARPDAESMPWLFAYGGELIMPAAMGIIYLAAGFPALLYLLWKAYRGGHGGVDRIALSCYPALSVGLATMAFYIYSPLQVIALLNAIVMAEIVRYRRPPGKTIAALVLFLTMGIIGSGYLVARDTAPQIEAWRGALQHPQELRDSREQKLGQWLAAHRLTTLIDLHSGYKVVAARGDALDLITPYSDRYKLLIQGAMPEIGQVALPDPDSYAGRMDELNRLFPGFYDFGMPGYHLAYDAGGWRVYRKM